MSSSSWLKSHVPLVVGLLFVILACAVGLALFTASPTEELPGPYTPRTVAGVLIVIGLCALIAEIKVVSYGLFTAFGVICLGTASWLVWSRQLIILGIRPEFLIAGLFAVCAVTIFLIVLASKSQKLESAMGSSSFVGEKAIVEKALCPDGMVQFRGALWKARSSRPVARGAEVVVVKLKGLELEVEALGGRERFSSDADRFSNE